MAGSNLDVSRYDNKLVSADLVSTPRAPRILTYWAIGLMLLLFMMLFLPWQQNITGYGKLTAYTPQDRPQTMESTIPGRIIKWHVKEGEYVNEGDTLVELAEIKDAYFDPRMLQRLEQQITGKKQSIDANKEKVLALKKQIEALRQGLTLSLEKAQNKLLQANNKFQIDSIDQVAAVTQYEIAKLQLERGNELFGQGLISLVQLEQRKLRLQDSQAKLIGSENKVLAARNELINATIELNSIKAEYTDKLSKAESDLNASQGYVFDAEVDLAKLENYNANMEIRAGFYVIRAPQDGYVVRALKQGVGEVVKEGEAIVTIMPSNPQMAVELYVRAMDLPLIAKGTHVRLQFDGWPAIQFSGWPSLSVGTFGGVISVIDYIDSKQSTYRLLIVPDPKDEPWPTILRVGTGAYGWAMLKEVSVWYEIWRQVNGFPPDLLYDLPNPGAPEKSSNDANKK